MSDGPQSLAELSVALDPLISYAMSQNAIPVVREVRVTNRGDTQLTDLSICIQMEPSVAPPWKLAIPALSPQATYATADVPLEFDHLHLMNLTERVRGRCQVSLTQRDTTLVTRAHDIELLAYNEWRADTLPQLLASFVQPNHPVVAETLNLARRHLQVLTGDPALEGYQSHDPARVRAIAQAIYQTMQELGITYASPPASFRGAGQKVRTPDQVLTQQMGTCLDLALFYAACLEQIGLIPVLVVLNSHAYSGVWLDKDHPTSVLWDDAAMVRNEVDAGKLLLIDSSTIAHRPVVPFDRAAQTGRSLLEQRFDYMIDVACARSEKVLPLPSRVEAGRFQPAPTVVVRAEPLDPATEKRVRELLRAAETAAARSQDTPKARPSIPENVKERLERWRSRLLDLTLHNSLLNARSTKLIALIPPDLARLEDELAKGALFTLNARAKAFSETDPRSAEIYKAHTGGDAVAELAAQALASNKLLTQLDEETLERRLTELARSGRTSMEEGGVHTVFLTLGTLSWYEADSSEIARSAPLILLPVQLQRDSARERYRLRLADEDAIFNVTLLEKLRHDFDLDIPELSGDLPQDDAGLDVSLIFNHVRHAIRGLRRWEVKNEAVLGQFSFNKLLMWRDLGTHAHHLLESDVVRHLAQGAKQAFPDQGAFPSETRLDAELKLAEFPCPKDADSSQLAAIEAARTGKSFVLQGPPGTGKSQTITNLIAATLAQGKTVLFVSEKMAALDVVHQRLRQVGLSDFCLELHSNKARKKAVIEQLGATLDSERHAPAARWAALADELSQTGADLNRYVEALHRPRANGFSAFQGLAQLAGLHDAPYVNLALGPASALTPDRLTTLERRVQALVTASDEVGDLAAHPFRSSQLKTFDPALTQRLPELCDRALKDLRDVREAATGVRTGLLGGVGLTSPDELQRMADLATAVVTSPSPRLALLHEPDIDHAKQQLHAFAAAGSRCDALTADLSARWDDGLFQLDLQGLLARFRQWAGGFFLVALFMLWTARRTLRRVVRASKLPKNAELLGDLERALETQRLSKDLQKAAVELARWAGQLLATDAKRWQRVAAQADAAVELRAGARAASLPAPAVERLLLLGSWESKDDDRSPGDRELLARFASAWDHFRASRDAVLAAVAAEHDAALGTQAGYIDRTETLLRDWASQPKKLRAVAQLRAEEAATNAAGLGGLVDALLSRQLANSQALPALQRAFHTQWVNAVVRDDDVLNTFSVRRHSDEIRHFAQLDKEYIASAGQQVARELARRLPKDGGTGGEVGILRREMQKQRRHLPIRQLFEKIPTLVRRLKPCVLMSPLSVAQYLQPGQAAFDLVVFDEASQIPVPDSIGAIARGRQLIVVGDSKQLPPTNFFGRASDSEDETPTSEDTVEELESILDECIAAQIPQLLLKWHYRSQHESLITFSNFHYYDNRLLTFPAADDRRHVMGVSHVAVPDGVYESGKCRHNKKEAETVVAEVVRRLRDPKERVRSIGIVTFSQPQMSLIESMLDEARRKHPDIEPYFGDAAAERVFVKNLENVQGDERDLIFFSVGYGPDFDNRVSMNFGPLNREGGERRLNVAVTRARQQLVVYSTLRADQIDLRRTRAVGARHLKLFLEYAQRGPKAIAQATASSPDATLDSPFEQRVHDLLCAEGWDVELQVGCSGYRIDLAIRDRDNPGRYLAGVECDGAYYHSAKTARDRDRLRQAVLESLGWTLLRIWSTDFWLEPEIVIGRIHAQLTRLQEAARRSEKTLVGANAPVNGELVVDDGGEPRPDGAGAIASVAPRPATRFQTQGSKPPPPSSEPLARRTVPPPVPPAAVQGSANERTAYRLAKLPAFLGSDEEFYEAQFSRAIAKCIAMVLQVEAPIHRRLLVRRVIGPFCLERATARVNDRVNEVLRSMHVRIEDDFVMPAELEIEQWRGFRVPSEDPDAARKSDEIHVAELANAAIHVLERNMGMERAELAREIALVFGGRRVTPSIASDMDRGVQYLLSSGRAREKGGQVVLS